MYARIRAWLLRSLLPIGSILSAAASVYIVVLWCHETDSKKTLQFLTALIVTSGFGMGLFQFSATAARQRRESVMTQVTKVTQEIATLRDKLHDKGVLLEDFLEAAGLPQPTKFVTLDLLQEADEKTEEEETAKKLAIQILNNLEQIAVGIRYGVYDPGLTWDFAGNIITRSWIVFRPFVEEERDKANWPAFAEELEWLHNGWAYRHNKAARDREKFLNSRKGKNT